MAYAGPSGEFVPGSGGWYVCTDSVIVGREELQEAMIYQGTGDLYGNVYANQTEACPRVAWNTPCTTDVKFSKENKLRETLHDRQEGKAMEVLHSAGTVPERYIVIEILTLDSDEVRRKPK